MIFHYKSGDAQSHKELGRKLQGLKKGEYTVEVKKNYPIRSNDHNRYYRAVLKIIATHTGIDEDTLHEDYKQMYNYKIVKFPNGEERSVPQSTKMDSDKFSFYVNKVKTHARDFHGCVIVEPGDLDLAMEMRIKEQYDKVFNQF